MPAKAKPAKTSRATKAASSKGARTPKRTPKRAAPAATARRSAKRTVRVQARGVRQRIVPFLWFDHRAEEAARFYTSLFGGSRIVHVARYGEGGPVPAGTVMSVNFQLEGQDFIALNGGPVYRFTPAVSFFVHCSSQEEIDFLWDRLLEGGAAQQCGWLQDRFGLSWQIVPTALGEMLADPDPARAQRVLHAMLGMVKLDLRALRAAQRGA